MGCLAGCLRLLLGALWRALLAAFAAVLFARVDRYVGRRYGTTGIGRLYLRARRRSQQMAGPPPSRDGPAPGPI